MGKTLTAGEQEFCCSCHGSSSNKCPECVAGYTRRPLISIAAGDIGSGPRELEQNVDEFFRQGKD